MCGVWCQDERYDFGEVPVEFECRDQVEGHPSLVCEYSGVEEREGECQDEDDF